MKVVITELNWPIGIEILQSKGWEIVYRPDLWKDRETLQHELVNADALIVRNQTKVDKELLSWDHQLKVIGRLGVGLDNIDLQATTERDIKVVFGRNANATSVAEYVIAAIFSFSRLLKEASEEVKAGNWDRKTYTGMEVYGKTLGLIGLGEIGHRVAARARAMGMHVVGFDPFVCSFDFPVMETGIQMLSFDQVIATSDFISLHVPLTPKTRDLFKRETFKKMKPSSVIINSARGGIINETDLNEALLNGWIEGAVLDVLEKEPLSEFHPLKQRKNCIITPHIAGLTEESQVRTSELVAREVINELEGIASLCRVRV